MKEIAYTLSMTESLRYLSTPQWLLFTEIKKLLVGKHLSTQLQGIENYINLIAKTYFYEEMRHFERERKALSSSLIE